MANRQIEAATPAQRRAYARKLTEISRRFDNFEESTIREMRGLLNETRKQINGRVAIQLAAGNDPTAVILTETVAEIDGMIDGLDSALVRLTNNSMNEAAIVGQQYFIEPFEAAGVSTLNFNIRPSLAQVNVLTDFTADLITRTTAEMRRQIVSEVRFAAMSGRSATQAMRNINRIVGGGPGFDVKLTRGITYRAERIYRTELNRAFSVANHSQQQAAAEIIPDLQKRWIATGDFRTREDHLRAHGQIVPVDKPFMIDGIKLDYPHDPAAPGSQTINCRCRSVTIHPDIGVVETPEDKRVRQEREDRGEERRLKKERKTDKLDLTKKEDIDKFIELELGRETDPIKHIRPTGRAPRGKGPEYADRRAIANKIRNHIKMRDTHTKTIEEYRGQRSGRRRVTIAQTRKEALSQGIAAALEVADGPGDWAFKRELIDGIFEHVSFISTGVR